VGLLVFVGGVAIYDGALADCLVSQENDAYFLAVSIGI
jgi:hypothetical protein